MRPFEEKTKAKNTTESDEFKSFSFIYKFDMLIADIDFEVNQIVLHN